MGTQLRAAGLRRDGFKNVESCNEILDVADPGAIETKYLRLQTG